MVLGAGEAVNETGRSDEGKASPVLVVLRCTSLHVLVQPDVERLFQGSRSEERGFHTGVRSQLVLPRRVGDAWLRGAPQSWEWPCQPSSAGLRADGHGGTWPHCVPWSGGSDSSLKSHGDETQVQASHSTPRPLGTETLNGS